jgi:hypothetical protein
MKTIFAIILFASTCYAESFIGSVAPVDHYIGDVPAVAVYFNEYIWQRETYPTRTNYIGFDNMPNQQTTTTGGSWTNAYGLVAHFCRMTNAATFVSHPNSPLLSVHLINTIPAAGSWFSPPMITNATGRNVKLKWCVKIVNTINPQTYGLFVSTNPLARSYSGSLQGSPIWTKIGTNFVTVGGANAWATNQVTLSGLTNFYYGFDKMTNAAGNFYLGFDELFIEEALE